MSIDTAISSWAVVSGCPSCGFVAINDEEITLTFAAMGDPIQGVATKRGFAV